MSSKVLKRGAGEVHEFQWGSGPAKNVTPLYGAAPPKKQVEEKADPNAARVAELESRVRQLEREVEQRSQSALQQGLKQGDTAARQQMAAQVDAVMQRLARSIEDLSGVKQKLRREAEQDMVQLALAIARRILHRELSVDPTAMLGLVKAAFDQLDMRELHRVRVHPEHAPILQQHLQRIGAPRRIEVEGDPAIERGGVIFETARGSMDASANTQLAEIERGFTDLVRHST